MEKASNIRSFIIILTVVLISAPIISSPCYSVNEPNKVQTLLISKKAVNPFQSGIQLPYEGKELEEENGPEDKSKQTLFFICLLSRPIRYIQPQTFYFYNVAPRSCGNASGVPLYLGKRVLLI